MGARKKKGLLLLLLLLLLLQTPRFTETTGHSGLQQQNNRCNRMGIWIKPARARCKNKTELCAQRTHKDLPPQAAASATAPMEAARAGS
jgi:hypothetical protein